jgi:hypothetical protein
MLRSKLHEGRTHKNLEDIESNLLHYLKKGSVKNEQTV